MWSGAQSPLPHAPVPLGWPIVSGQHCTGARAAEMLRPAQLQRSAGCRGQGHCQHFVSQNKNDGELPREVFVRQHSCFYRPAYLRHHQWVPVSAGEAGTGLVVMPLHRQCYGTWPLLAKKITSHS